MKILAIRLKNLTSIEGAVEVDFTVEPLNSAGIFAISGPTGAGKSTLLDALCLALYDKAPRFASSVESVNLADVGDNQINQSDVRNLLRRGTSDGYAEVDFLGMDGHRYRSRWSVRRAKFKPTGSLQSQVMEVKDLDTEQVFQGTKKELLAQLTDLVGLTYEQFTRTVLLAQNDFATFLKSKGAAKAELLEKLTGTAVYSRISQEIYQRHKALQEGIALIRGRMEMIELLPEDAWNLLKQEKQEEVAKRERGNQRLAALTEQLNRVQQMKAQQNLWIEKEKEERSEQEKRKQLEEVLVQQEEEYARFKVQCEVIQPDLVKARQLDVQILSKEQDFGQVQRRWQEASARLKDQEAKWEAVKVRCRQAYTALVRLLDWPASKPSLQMEQVDEVLRREEQVLQREVEVNEERWRQMNALGYPSLLEEQGMCQKELGRIQQIRDLANAMQDAQQEAERLKKESVGCAQQLAKQQVALETVQRVYENARLAVGKDVKALRQHLRDGEACPVCGSIQHPYTQQAEVIDTLYCQLEQEYKGASEAFQRLKDQQVANQRDWAHFQQAHEQRLAQRKLLLNEMVSSACVQKLMGAESISLSSVFADRCEGEKADGASQQVWMVVEDRVQARLAALAEQIRKYVGLQQEWQQADAQIKQLRTRCEGLRGNVEQYRLATEKVHAGQEHVAILRQAVLAEQQLLQGVEQALRLLREERSGLLKGKSVEVAEQALKRKDKEWQQTLDQIRKSLEGLERRLAELRGEMKALAQHLEEWKAQVKQMEAPEALPEAIAKQQAENQQREQLLSAIELRLLQQEQHRQELERVKKELDERLGVAERWAKLNKLLGSADGAKFKVIAQSYTLNLLLRHANKHLEYLSKRYKLQQVPGTLALQVIDCDMCDEVRTVYSLSGGESFLISLALALGLSSLSSNNLKVDSLFIDEGFGSLDADSLRTAMEALEQLQMQGRKVGVISHVQEMSERISVQIQVHKKVNGKSVLTVVG